MSRVSFSDRSSHTYALSRGPHTTVHCLLTKFPGYTIYACVCVCVGVFSGSVIAKLHGERWRWPESNSSVVVLDDSNSCGYRTDKYIYILTVRRLLLRYYYCNTYTTTHTAHTCNARSISVYRCDRKPRVYQTIPHCGALCRYIIYLTK